MSEPESGNSAPTGGVGPSHYILLSVGLVLVLVPILMAHSCTEAYGEAQRFLRILAALGAGLIAAFIPGALHVQFPGVEAVGGIAAFALVLIYDPLWKVDAVVHQDGEAIEVHGNSQTRIEEPPSAAANSC